MRQFLVNSWNGIMDHRFNPLKNIPDMQVRHMVMQVLAFMWSAVFAILIVDSVYAFGLSAVGHVLFVGAIVITVATFNTAEKRPWAFGTYHSVGRQRGYVWARDKKGRPYKVALDPNDPGGEHE